MAYFHDMYRKKTRYTIIFLLFNLVYFDSSAQLAQVQFIHNSADTALSHVSIWMNQTLWADSVAYHEATPMAPLPAADTIHWEIRSTSDSTIIHYSWTSFLAENSKNIYTVHGHLQSTFQPYRPLSVEHFNEALSQSASTGSVDILFFHGATELDTIDVAETELFELTAFDQLPYGRFSEYISLFPADYGWSILSDDGGEIFGEYALPITALNWAGQAITIVTGGYFNQANNNNGQALGMWATTAAGGPMVCLQPLQWNLSAHVQFIHNAGPPASEVVRITVDNLDWQNPLNEHSSTPFMSFPAGRDAVVSIRSAILQSPNDSLWSDTLHLYSGNHYQLIWFGGFSAQTSSQLLIREYDDTSAINEALFRMRLFHGASPWESIRLLADTLNQTSLIDSVPFGFLSDAITLPVENQEWLLFSGNDSITALQAPLDTLSVNQQTITALTCDDMHESGISLWLSRETGGPMQRLSTLVIPEPPIFCDLQWVHASSDTLLQTVDMWINDSLLAPGFSFETASSFATVQCNAGVITRITQAGNPSLVYFTDTLLLPPNQPHRIILWGFYDVNHYNPAPPLNWHIDENILASSTINGNTDIRFFHTAADIGAVQINEASIPIVPFFNEVEVGEMSYIQSLSGNQNYGIEVINAPTQFLYESYALPALEQSWENQSITLISTGFRQPVNNSNGEPLQVWALLPNGSMQALPQFVLTENTSNNSSVAAFPNPANETIRIQAAAIAQGVVTLRIIDICGKVIHEKKCLTHQGNIDETIETSSVTSGLYAVQLLTETSVFSASLVIQH